ncbi:MAG TPA: hypothetical protein VEN81_13725 [Planctomycetota bacterium]|nr:hypothetical protein [Planctomycetota bacterium]
MNQNLPRRTLLKGSLSGAAWLGLRPLGLLPALRAEETRLDPGRLAPGGGLEPLVRLVEETSRDRLLEEVGSRVTQGLPDADVLAALLLAGVRNVQPRPVGFKFHTVLSVNAAHQSSLAGPDADRWLPLFWALDNFKVSQADEAKKTGWKQGPVDESKLPSPARAKKALIEALEAWDVEGIDAPAVAFVRTAGAHEVFELFARYGARDFRDIGHKIIYVAGAWRVLSLIGWQHAEPVLRSLAQALQYFTGESPAKGDQDADRPGRQNLELLRKIRPEWREGKPDPAGAQDLLVAFRQGSPKEMAEKAVDLLNRGVAAGSIWDAVHASTAEIVMSRVNIQSIHSQTTMNALRYCYDTSADDETRRFLLLQAASFIPLFRGKLEKVVKIDELEPRPGATVQEIFADVSGDKLAASSKLMGYLKEKGDPRPVLDAARVLIFLKGRDAHDYKFSAAILEDYYRLSPGWRDRFLAGCLHYLKGSGAPDNGLVKRIRESLKA